MRRDSEVFRWLKWILFRRERVKKFSRAEVSEADIAEEEGTGSRTTLLSFGVAQPFEKLLSTLAEGKERPLDAVAGGGEKKRTKVSSVEQLSKWETYLAILSSVVVPSRIEARVFYVTLKEKEREKKKEFTFFVFFEIVLHRTG